MKYYVDFTSGDKTERIAEITDMEKGKVIGKEKQTEYKAEGKKGIISLYETTTERGRPMSKCHEFWEI